ncbi:MAG: TolC family protein [Elusimicrobia bacterium]|nr:TolC family protein [Elusimicrobiota bacterium]
MRLHRLALFLGAPVLSLSGCVSTSARRPAGEVESMVQERAGARLSAVESDTSIQNATSELLKQPLSPESAVQLALLNNPSFRGRVAELGIAQAALAQAALLENPKVHASLRFPRGGEGRQTGSEIGGTINFLDLITLPLRRKLASTQLEQAKYRLGHETLELATEVKAAYYHLQATRQTLELRRFALEGLEAASILSERQRKAGNISKLDEASQQAAYQEAKLEVGRAEVEEVAARERFAALIGAQAGPWTIADKLAEPPAVEPVLEKIETTALSQRWDLAAARREPSVLKQALRVNRLSMFSSIDVGIDSERELDGVTGVGPEVEMSVPLFDRKQASSAKLKAQLRQSQSTLAGLETQIRLQTRIAHAQLVQTRAAISSYQTKLLPLKRRIVAETLKNYNYMLLGVYQLLESKRAEIEAQSAYIDTLKSYWVHWAELERAAGGRLPQDALQPAPAEKQEEQPEQPSRPEQPQPGHEHHEEKP